LREVAHRHDLAAEGHGLRAAEEQPVLGVAAQRRGEVVVDAARIFSISWKFQASTGTRPLIWIKRRSLIWLKFRPRRAVQDLQTRIQATARVREQHQAG